MDTDDAIILKLRNAQIPFTVFGQTLLSFANSFAALQIANASAAVKACKEMQRIIETSSFQNRMWCNQLHNYLITGNGAGTACELMCKTMVLVGQPARIVTPRRWMHVDRAAIGDGYFVVPRIDIEDEGCDWWGFGEFLSEHSACGGGVVLGSRTLELPTGMMKTIEKVIVYTEHFEVDGLPDRRATKRTPTPGAVMAAAKAKDHKDV